MYQVTVYNKATMKTFGPVYFTGEDGDFETLKEAREAAESWVSEQKDSSDLQVESRIVGCL